MEGLLLASGCRWQGPVPQGGDRHEPEQTQPGDRAAAGRQLGVLRPAAVGFDPAVDRRGRVDSRG